MPATNRPACRLRRRPVYCILRYSATRQGGLWRDLLPKRCPFNYVQIVREEATAFSEPDNRVVPPENTP